MELGCVAALSLVCHRWVIGSKPDYGLLHGGSWYLRVPTRHRLQHSIVDKHILILKLYHNNYDVLIIKKKKLFLINL